jgi:protease-4
MSADEVLSLPSTITGSIGVFALLPSVDKAWQKLSLHTHGTTTTWLAGAFDLRRPLEPRARELLQSGVEHAYNEFITRAAAARKLTAERMNELAQGRVWSGRQAKDNGLVDGLGTYHEALRAAARRGGLGDDFRITYVEREPRGVDRLLDMLFGESARNALSSLALFASGASVAPEALQSISSDLLWLRQALRDPLALQSHCLCSPEGLLGAD